MQYRRRSPCGERGLKSSRRSQQRKVYASLPVRGAWIEIRHANCHDAIQRSSLPVRGAWIEMKTQKSFALTRWSLPVRGAWIEMPSVELLCKMADCRSPCGERGLKSRLFCSTLRCNSRSPCGERGLKFSPFVVVPRSHGCRSPCGERGLKFDVVDCCPDVRPSLPVRGAWVEIAGGWRLWLAAGSLPVRGAWIEIPGERDSGKVQRVAPRAGSVD